MNHFVGTHRKIPLKGSPNSIYLWDLVLTQIKRFATPGCMIPVYYVHSPETEQAPITYFKKAEQSLWQAPSCTLPCSFGIQVPIKMQIPIDLKNFNLQCIENWEITKKKLVMTLDSEKDVRPTNSY
jgi:hypothetical protein